MSVLLAPLTDLSPLALLVMTAGLALASLARGYSGFGFSAVLVASWSLVGPPALAVAVTLLLEVAASVMQAASVWRDIPWRRVALLGAGAAIGAPFGVYLLAMTDAATLRLGIAGFILAAAIALLAGLKLRRRTNTAGVLAVGAASGLCNGAVAMGGLPVAIFLTAEGDSPRAIRAAFIAYFFFLDIASFGLLAREGLATPAAVTLAVLALPVLGVGMYLGGRHFLGATPEGFRRVTLLLLILLALLGFARALI